jgi:hypothetical protein
MEDNLTSSRSSQPTVCCDLIMGRERPLLPSVARVTVSPSCPRPLRQTSERAHSLSPGDVGGSAAELLRSLIRRSSANRVSRTFVLRAPTKGRCSLHPPLHGPLFLLNYSREALRSSMWWLISCSLALSSASRHSPSGPPSLLARRLCSSSRRR